MAPMLLTKSTTFIIGPVAELIGIIMNVIFDILAKIGLPNLGISIIIMTILIYMLMLPLTIRQQKFSKLQRKMQPELQKIQKKTLQFPLFCGIMVKITLRRSMIHE